MELWGIGVVLAVWRYLCDIDWVVKVRKTSRKKAKP
jgi:hypothetical protein